MNRRDTISWVGVVCVVYASPRGHLRADPITRIAFFPLRRIRSASITAHP